MESTLKRNYDRHMENIKDKCPVCKKPSRRDELYGWCVNPDCAIGPEPLMIPLEEWEGKFKASTPRSPNVSRIYFQEGRSRSDRGDQACLPSQS